MSETGTKEEITNYRTYQLQYVSHIGIAERICNDVYTVGF